MGYITLTTDFGTIDGSQTVLHGVIYAIAPDAHVMDLTHAIQPQNIRHAAFVMSKNVFYFPKETVHVVVVDPGVGTERRAIAARIGSQLFVAPDNGVLTPMYIRAEDEGWPLQIYEANRPAFWRTGISDIFHGRDVFAPLGAHLAAGRSLQELGEEIDDAIRIDWPQPIRTPEGVRGTILHIDHFGNAISNIHPHDIAHLGDVHIKLCGAVIEGMVRTFGDSPYDSDTLIALWDSNNYLMISENNGTGGKVIQPRPGDEVFVCSR
ncbi:MAG: SAM-dependent chlorinase/fluorinase [Anaerolineales bacterium]|nr:SAM-dependent chlorinase/fluorinase [Anaerolineales bacterium]